MHYNVGDKLLLCGIESRVFLVSAYGNAYLVPEVSGEDYNNKKTTTGVVFAVVGPNGKDKLGNKVLSINNQECGAV